MQGLTPEGQRIIDDIASRGGFSSEAVMSLFHALALGNGAQAQFNHPELGGMGQWSQGGMIMIGDMFNQGLKQRVAALCDELAGVLHRQHVFVHPEKDSASNSSSSWQSQNYNVSGASVSLFAQGFGRNWWPDGLGAASSSGSQNNLQYAYFPNAHRLAIKQADRITIFDSGDHNISGVSQQQGGDQTLTFTSQYGVVRLSDLPVVSPEQSAKPSAPPRPSVSFTPVDPQINQAPPPAPASADIFATIERLADLRQKNILSEEEFAAKKTELLARL
ncbi:conserved hypothetical protein [Methylocella tundrae]|uniref:SHOCT domain-containing protein n=1 Tax=Methylocella tundrae TaxID=227605 RepID=A0A8B6M2G1_METTU|nr:SHOCT domain-containing protein [Methylocella tundrae]VTZ26959.1 conserved hypothetical protein [Methylocella tundrae]VTZ48964.1 conserved hypothetical protein [Methylocella tundrae]